MYWIYNVLLIFYWIGLIPVILYRLAFEDGFYERIKQSAGYMPASLLKKIELKYAVLLPSSPELNSIVIKLNIIINKVVINAPIMLPTITLNFLSFIPFTPF